MCLYGTTPYIPKWLQNIKKPMNCCFKRLESSYSGMIESVAMQCLHAARALRLPFYSSAHRVRVFSWHAHFKPWTDCPSVFFRWRAVPEKFSTWKRMQSKLSSNITFIDVYKLAASSYTTLYHVFHFYCKHVDVFLALNHNYQIGIFIIQTHSSLTSRNKPRGLANTDASHHATGVYSTSSTSITSPPPTTWPTAARLSSSAPALSPIIRTFSPSGVELPSDSSSLWTLRSIFWRETRIVLHVVEHVSVCWQSGSSGQLDAQHCCQSPS